MVIYKIYTKMHGQQNIKWKNSGGVYTFTQKENNSSHIRRQNVKRNYKSFSYLHNTNILLALMKYEIRTNVAWKLSARLTGNGPQFQQKDLFSIPQYPAFENHTKQTNHKDFFSVTTFGTHSYHPSLEWMKSIQNFLHEVSGSIPGATRFSEQ